MAPFESHMKEPLIIKVPVPQIRIAVLFWYPNKSVLRYVLSTIGVGIKVLQPQVSTELPSIVLIRNLLAAWIFCHFYFHKTGTLIQNWRSRLIKATKTFPNAWSLFHLKSG